MVGRLIQKNPFCLSSVDNMFFEDKNEIKNFQIIILEYFNYIRKKINEDTIFRLLSPLLYIFFGVPNGKKFKAEINEKMKNYEIDKLESLFLQLIK